jgi:hypothetical protein
VDRLSRFLQALSTAVGELPGFRDAWPCRASWVGGLVECAEDLAQRFCESGKLPGCGRMQDVQVDGPVLMDDPVPQAGRLLPGDLGKLGFDLTGEISCGLAEDSEVPQQGIAADAVCFQVADLSPTVRACACSAASIISVNKRTSRRIHRPCLGED